MHLRGHWKPPRPGEAAPHGELSLELGPDAQRESRPHSWLVIDGALHQPDARELLRRPDLLETAFGLFAYVHMDARRFRVEIGTDRLGFGPLYYVVAGGELHFASAPALLFEKVDSPTPDYDAWNQILCLGDLLGDRTPVRQIRRLLPGTRIACGPTGITFERYWRPEHPDAVGAETFVRENNRLLAEALDLQAGGGRPRVLPLSGGDDSRRLAAVFREQGIAVECVTQSALHKNERDDDVLVAREVARHLDLPLITLPLPSPESALALLHERDRLLAFETHHHAWAIPMCASLPQGVDAFDGIVGDVTVNGHFPRVQPEAIAAGHDAARLARLLSPPHRAFELDPALLESPLEDQLAREIDRLPASPSRAAWFYLLNHTRRTIGAWHSLFRLFGHRVCCPFTYHPLLVQSLSLDPVIQGRDFFQMVCTGALDPALAAIPSTRRGVPDKLAIDLSAYERELGRLKRATLRLRPGLSRTVPGLRGRIRSAGLLRHLLRLFPGSTVDWFYEPVWRFGRFLDWIEERPTFAFPPTSKLAPALRARFALEGRRIDPVRPEATAAPVPVAP